MLAAASQYFCAMFTSDLKECKMKRIPIRGVDMATMRLIIEFAYTGKVTVNEENVHHLLLAANMFQVSATGSGLTPTPVKFAIAKLLSGHRHLVLACARSTLRLRRSTNFTGDGSAHAAQASALTKRGHEARSRL